MHGDQPLIKRAGFSAAGFSPHVRGSTWSFTISMVPLWILPACAGVNPPTDRLLCSYAHSPRTRGGQPAFFMKKLAEAQFSPHARGSTRSNRVDDTGGTILPARAGGNLTCRCSGCMMMHSPRTRGGQPSLIAKARNKMRFTPYARGSTLVHGDA